MLMGLFPFEDGSLCHSNVCFRSPDKYQILSPVCITCGCACWTSPKLWVFKIKVIEFHVDHCKRVKESGQLFP